jgi:hypothetical protein
MFIVDLELLNRMRAFAKEPGALFIPIQGPSGPVPIWADDINAATSDDELVTVISFALGCRLDSQ